MVDLYQQLVHIILLELILFIGYKEIVEHLLIIYILKLNVLMFVLVNLLKIQLFSFVKHVIILVNNVYQME